jgi:hypothetical protein
MVNARKHKAKKQNQNKETKEEFEERIINQMQAGFKWSHENWSIREIMNAYKKGKLIDPDYQRKKVWQQQKNKALIETILKYGGNKIPTITFRKVGEDEEEIVDGKQRLLSAIIPFCEDEFSINGVYEDNFAGKRLSDIKKEYPAIHTAFMGTTLPIQVASNMSDDEARIYFIQINNSGVNMTLGEQIHGMQGTPLIKSIDELLKHPVWNYVQNIKRYGEYAYVSRMLLHVITFEKDEEFMVFTKKQLLDSLEVYYEVNVPQSAINSLKKTMTALSKMFKANNICLSVREFFTVFIYVHKYLNKMDLNSFGEFISGLYQRIHHNPTGIFSIIKYQPHQSGYDYNVRYYNWYVLNITYLYDKFVKGASWDDIRRSTVKG